MQPLTKQEAAALLTHWRFPAPPTVDEVRPTLFDVPAPDRWAVGDQWLLALYEREETLKRHLLLSDAMANLGYDAATAVSTREGAPYIQYGSLYACLQKRLMGKALPSGRLLEEGMTETRRAYGRAVAQLHAALREVQQQDIFDTGDLFADVEGKVMARTRAALALPDSWEADWQRDTKAFKGALNCQLIHRDLHADNLLLNPADGRIGFDAFDASLIYPRLFDPCYLATSLLSGCVDEPEMAARWFGLLKDILAGYEEVSPLTAAEKRAVPYVVMAIEMFFIAYLHGTDHPYHEVGSVNVRMLGFLIKNQEALRSPN